MITIIALFVIVAFLSIWLVNRPEKLGSMNHVYKEPITCNSEIEFQAAAGDRLKFSFSSTVESGSLDIILYDSEGNQVYVLDKAKVLEAFHSLDDSDTYTLAAECSDFIGEYKIKVYKVDDEDSGTILFY